MDRRKIYRNIALSFLAIYSYFIVDLFMKNPEEIMHDIEKERGMIQVEQIFEERENDLEKYMDFIAPFETPDGECIKEAYKDSMGYWTIGYGRVLEPEIRRDAIKTLEELGYSYDDLKKGKVRIDDETCLEFFREDVENALRIAKEYLPNFENYPEKVKMVVVDMAYNLGPKLFQFREMREALIKGDYAKAGEYMRDSKWFYQVGRRAENHYEILINMGND